MRVSGVKLSGSYIKKKNIKKKTRVNIIEYLYTKERNESEKIPP
jgi:hypothetical protein